MKKIIMPIIIVIVIGGIIALYLSSFLFSPLDIKIKIISGVVLGGILATLIYVFIERIKEIKEEEKDDISKY